MINQRMRDIRKKKGIKQNFVASKIGKSPTWLHDVETGRIRLSVEMAKKIADVLEVEVSIFFEENILVKRSNQEQTATSA